jgi:hypothetical protein
MLILLTHKLAVMRITITYDQFGQDAEIEFDNYADAYDFVWTMPCGDVQVAGSR